MTKEKLGDKRTITVKGKEREQVRVHAHGKHFALKWQFVKRNGSLLNESPRKKNKKTGL